jgi:signal transduction histidine kinase
MQTRLNDLRDRGLLDRMRAVVRGETITETELRALVERAATWIGLLESQLEASERRLDQAAERLDDRLADAVTELRQSSALRPRIDELRTLLSQLEDRARELRRQWLAG